MEKRLEVKVKKIVGQPNPKEGKWSNVLSFEPENEELKKSRGQLFAVLDLTGSAALDLSQFGRLTLETLRDEYYASEEPSPLQALEEAIHKAQHRLVELVFGPGGAVSDSTLNYNFAAAVLWGTVLYLAKFGASGLYLRRVETIEELGGAKNEKVFSASGMVRNGDVVVLGSSDFRRTFSVGELPEALDSLESLVNNLGNPPGISGLVLRFGLESVPGEEEEVLIASVVERESGLKRFLKRFSFLRSKTLLLIPISLFLAATAFTINKRRDDFRAAEARWLVSQAEQTLADAEQYIDLNNSRARELLLRAREDFVAAEVLGAINEIDTLLDKVNKVTKVKPEIVEATVSFDPLSKLDSPPKVDGSVVDVGTYFGNVYFLVPSENQILKAAVVAGGDYAEPGYWVTTENPPLRDAVSMAIDGFIYVLKADGQVLKFEKGELASDFGLKDLDKPLVDPRAIFTPHQGSGAGQATVDSEHLYILDAGNQRVVVTNKNGLYQSQYVYEGLTNPTDLFVDEAVGVIYLLDGADTFRVEM